MKTKRLKALFKKEIIDIFRDKKTIFMMLVLPLLLYPLLMIGMALLMSAITANQAQTVYKVSYENLEQTQISKIEDTFEDDSMKYKFKIVSSDNPQDDLQNKKIDCYISVNKNDGKDVFTMNYLSASETSRNALGAISEALKIYQEDIRRQKIEALGMDADEVLNSIQVDDKDYSTKEESVGFLLGTIIPFFVIISILLGAIYPAIDVTAGERERGTLETLLTLPVSNFEMIMSKFLAVAVISCITAVLNILSTGASMLFMVNIMAGSVSDSVMKLNMDIHTFLPAILFLVIVIIAFALFMTAICMCVCIFAKSFKEANNYITPVMLIVMFAGYSTMIPKVELTSATAAIPVVNIALMIESLFTFEYNYPLYGIVLLSNVAYSILTIWILGRLYNSEQVLFGEGLSSIKLVAKRSEMKERQMPGLGDVTLLLGVSLLLLIYVGSYMTVKYKVYGILFQQAMILTLPLCYAYYIKADFKKLFSLKLPNIKSILVSIIMGMGGFMFMLVAAQVLSKLVPSSLEQVNANFEFMKETPFLLLIFVVAVFPAIGEELLFRGFVYQSFRSKLKVIMAVLASSAIFGIYHMSFIKFFTTAILGIVFAVALEYSNSIYIGMVMHFCNNAFSVFAFKYPKVVEKYLPIFVKEKFTVVEILSILAISFALMAGAGFIIRKELKIRKNIS